MKVYYFGCVEQTEHYMHTPNLHSDWEFMRSNPWGYNVDNGLIPKDGSQFAIHHKDGWTALAFVDNTVDSRHGSNSAFLAEGNFGADEMIAFAEQHFPTIARRVHISRLRGADSTTKETGSK